MGCGASLPTGANYMVPHDVRADKSVGSLATSTTPAESRGTKVQSADGTEVQSEVPSQEPSAPEHHKNHHKQQQLKVILKEDQGHFSREEWIATYDKVHWRPVCIPSECARS